MDQRRVTASCQGTIFTMDQKWVWCLWQAGSLTLQGLGARGKDAAVYRDACEDTDQGASVMLYMPVPQPAGLDSPLQPRQAHRNSYTCCITLQVCVQGKSERRQGQAAQVLLADLRVAPGMEGAPVLNAQGELVGLLTVPLCHRHFHAEVGLLLPPTADCLSLCALSKSRPSSEHARVGGAGWARLHVDTSDRGADSSGWAYLGQRHDELETQTHDRLQAGALQRGISGLRLWASSSPLAILGVQVFAGACQSLEHAEQCKQHRTAWEHFTMGM